MKSIKKSGKLLSWISVGFLSGLVLISAAACNKKEQTVTPSEDPKPPVEQATVSASDLLDEMNEEGNIENALHEGAIQQLAEKLVNQNLASGQSAEVESLQIDGDSISVVYKKHFSSNKDDFAFASIVADLPSALKAALTTNWKDLILDKMSQNLIDESQLDAAKVEVNEIVDEVIASLANEEVSVKQSNTYVRNNTLVNNTTMSALREKFGDNISVGEVRKDESVVITSLDNGSLVEHLCQIYYTGTGETYEQIVTDGSKVNIVEKNIDISKPYAEPALRATVTAQQIFDQVFGEDFVLPTYEELLQEIADRTYVDYFNLDPIATGVENDTFYVYAQEIDNLGRDCLYKICYRGANDNIKNTLPSYNALSSSIFNLLQDDHSIIEETLEFDMVSDIIKDNISLSEFVTTIKSTDYKSWKCNNVLVSTKENVGDFNEYGAKLLEDVEYNKIIKTVVGGLGLKGFDLEKYFDTGYINVFDIAVLYTDKQNNLKIRTDNVAAPYYNDLDNVRHYQLFLQDKYVIRKSSTVDISDSIILTDQGVEKPGSELENDWEYEAETAWIDDRNKSLM